LKGIPDLKVFRAYKVFRVKLEIQVPQVILDLLETLDPLELQVLQGLLDRQGIPATPVIQETQAIQVTPDPQESKGLMGSRVG
jgi:hypothetical protein